MTNRISVSGSYTTIAVLNYELRLKCSKLVKESENAKRKFVAIRADCSSVWLSQT